MVCFRGKEFKGVHILPCEGSEIRTSIYEPGGSLDQVVERAFKIMLIKSDKEDTFLKFERTDTQDYQEVTVTASIGGFILSTGTWFWESERFLSSLSDFERTRRGSVSLSSDEFTMTIKPHDSVGSARIHFELSRQEYYGVVTAGTEFPSGRVTVTGEFGLSGEFIGRLLHDFSLLFRLEAHA